MTDRPIIFSAPMVRALLDGRKSQTRRVLKPQPPEWATFCEQPSMMNILHQWVPSGLWRWQEEVRPALCRTPRAWPVDDKGQHHWLRPPFARPDRLWVRERLGLKADGGIGWPIYMADEAWVKNGIVRVDPARLDGRPKASIHMPRWASRLTLIVTDVQVQQLQEISENDAVAEGALTFDLPAHGAPEKTGRPPLGPSLRQRFQALWTSLHGPDAWAANPWVVALTFTVERRNIDALAKAA